MTPREIYTYAYRIERKRLSNVGVTDFPRTRLALFTAHSEIAFKAEMSMHAKRWERFTGYIHPRARRAAWLSNELFERRWQWNKLHSPALAPDEIPF